YDDDRLRPPALRRRLRRSDRTLGPARGRRAVLRRWGHPQALQARRQEDGRLRDRPGKRLGTAGNRRGPRRAGRGGRRGAKGVARGWREAGEAGWLERVPMTVAAQAARANPISRAFRTSSPLTPVRIGYTVAEGLAAGDPGRKGQWVLRLLREGKGVAGEAED